MADLSSLSDEQLIAGYQQAVSNQAIAQNESGNAPVTATPVNPVSGAQGSMQVLPTTAANPGFGVKPSNGTPEDTARSGRDYMGALTQKYGDPTTAAIAYNWGPGNTDKWLARGAKLSDLPDETLKYAYNYQKNVAAAPQVQQPPQLGTGPAPMAYGAPDATPSSNTMPANWQAPNSLVMGMGDTIGGAARAIVHGLGKAANYIAPNSSFAQQAAQAEQQIDATRAAENARYTAAQAPRQPGAQLVRQAIGAPPGVQPDVGRAVGRALPALAIPTGAPSTILGAAGMGAGAGALMGAAGTQPGQSYPQQMAVGAGAGLAGGAAAALVGKVLAGATPTAEAQQMINIGAKPTPGQALGGFYKNTEEKATSIPVLGNAIKNAQDAGTESFNRAMYQNALAPIGAKLPSNVETGSQGVQHVNDTIGAAYQAVQPLATFTPRGQFLRDLGQVRSVLAQNAPEKLDQFDNIVQNNIADKLQNGSMNGSQWGDTRSTVSGIARNLRIGNSTPADRSLSDGLDDLNQAINDQVARNSPPQVIPQIQAANAAWARYKQIENAAGSTGASNNGNIFTAAQYTAAVRKGSTNAQRATNSGLNADLGAAAQKTFGNQYADSGTAGRSALMGVPAAAAGLYGLAAAGHLPAAAAIAGGLGAGTAAYGTDIGRNLMMAALFKRPALVRAMGQGLLSGAPAAGGAAATLTNDRGADQM